MTQAETIKILAMIAEMYPAFLKDRNPNMTSQLWHRAMENLPYEAVQTALMEFFATDTKGFAPSPGMLREIILSHMAKEEMTEMDAWKLVSKAIRQSTYYSRQEFEKLPPVLQRIIRSPQALHDWAAMDETTVQSSVFPWFRRAYASRLETERRENFLPSASLQMMRFLSPGKE